MSVSYEKEKKIFRLDTENSTYLIGLTTEGYVGHIYYGDRLEGEVENYLLRIDEHPFTPSVVKREKSSFLDRFPPAVSAISGRAASMSAMPTDAGAARSSMKATRSTKERKNSRDCPPPLEPRKKWRRWI